MVLSDGWKQGGANEEREETAVGAAVRPLVGAVPQQPTPHGDGLIISNHQRQLENKREAIQTIQLTENARTPSSSRCASLLHSNRHGFLPEKCHGSGFH